MATLFTSFDIDGIQATELVPLKYAERIVDDGQDGSVASRRQAESMIVVNTYRNHVVQHIYPGKITMLPHIKLSEKYRIRLGDSADPASLPVTNQLFQLPVVIQPTNYPTLFLKVQIDSPLYNFVLDLEQKFQEIIDEYDPGAQIKSNILSGYDSNEVVIPIKTTQSTTWNSAGSQIKKGSPICCEVHIQNVYKLYNGDYRANLVLDNGTTVDPPLY